jgi:HlyD family secretion protein
LLSEIAAFSFLAMAHLVSTSFQAEPNSDTRDKFVTAPVVQGQLAVAVTATGTVEPLHIVDVSTELSGTITRVHVEANQRVVVGEVLAELDAATWQQENLRAKAVVAAAMARLHQAEAERTALQKDLTRKSTLAQRGQTSQRDLDQSVSLAQQNVARIETLKAELAVAEADAKIAEARLAKARITAPIDGIVLRRAVEPGQTIASALAAPVLFRLAPDLDKMELRVNIDEADALRIRRGQTATFDVHALRGRRIDAVVERVHIGPEIVQGVVTYKAILQFDNREIQLRPGMTANADIVVDKVDRGLLVPNAALRFATTYLASVTTSEAPLGGLQRFWAAANPASRQAMPWSGVDEPLDADERLVLASGNGDVRPIRIRVGLSDGQLTHILAGDIDSERRVAVDLGRGPEQAGRR